MKKISFLKCLAMSVSALIVLSFSGCELLGLGTGSTVKTPDPAVYISQSEISLTVGDTVQLTAISTDGKAVEWESLAPEVATVVDGLVTGVAEGEATVMASTPAKMATCIIKVNKAASVIPGTGETPDPEVLVLSLSNLSLEVGNSVTLTATSSIGAEIIWDSSNKTVATVDKNGKVTAKTKGTAKISATTGTAKAECTITVTESVPANSQKDGYELIWYDEFEGSSLDTKKWGYQTGTHDQYGTYNAAEHNVDFWGNGEYQYYTEDAVSVAEGSLKITATRQSMPNGREYSSGRILTRDKQSWKYGYFEAKIRLSTTNDNWNGVWPAFWMLPQPTGANSVENANGGWPNSGEIDIMEAKGRLQTKIDTTIHFGETWPNNSHLTYEATLSNNSTIAQWHTYAVDWTAEEISWYVDGTRVYRLTNDKWWTPTSSQAAAPFDQNFYILLNLACGGGYDPVVNNETTTFTSASMYVDYVRVYKAV